MNKKDLNDKPFDEQFAGEILTPLAGDLQPSSAFQSRLERQLLEAYSAKSRSAQNWQTKVFRSLGWAIIGVCALIFLNWAVESLIPRNTSALNGISSSSAQFESAIPTQNVCHGQLAAAHSFSVFMTTQNNTGFVNLDEQGDIGELRSFSWSPDGQQLAIVGNTRGNGNLYLTNSDHNRLRNIISNSELGYLMGVAWSQSGKQLLTWESDNNSAIYIVNEDGTNTARIELPMQFFETPQFSPDNQSILFYGADQSSSGLFQVILDSLQVRPLSRLVENETSFAWSQDGLRLAFIEMDRTTGEARLMIQDQSGNVPIASLPIPKGSGASLPHSANLSWSPDGKSLVFEFGTYASNHSIYLANSDGTGMIKIAEFAHAPAISADGNCLAYIVNNQVLLLELPEDLSPLTTAETPELVLDLPPGRGRTDIQLDKLQWKPETSPLKDY